MIALVQSALREGLIVLAIPLGVALLVGVVVSFAQAVTQMQDMSLATVPKIVAVGLALFVLGPGLLSMLVSFTQTLWLRGAGLG